MSRSLRVAWPFSLLLALGCLQAPPEGETSEEIVGGTSDSGDAAVVALYGHLPNASTGALCSASVIAPTVLLTAAHCVLPQEVGNGAIFQAYLGADLTHQDPTQWVAVKEVHYDPQFSLSNLGGGHDVAVAILAAPVSITPLPINQSLPAAAQGAAARLIGYGLSNGAAGTGAGVKRQATATINQVTSNLLSIGNSAHETCNGDSGGPALLTIGGKEQIVGITSFGQVGCSGGGYDTRVDQYVSWIESFLCGGACGGNEPVCRDGACAACASDVDCPTSGQRACQPSGACGACSAGNVAACVGATPACDSSSGHCVACVTDAQCKSAAAPACNVATHTCVACDTDAQCKSAAAPACNVATHSCVACNSDAQCKSPSAPACNVATHSCVACDEDSQCKSASAPACNVATHACVACNSDAQCKSSSAPACNAATHSCVACDEDSQCKSPSAPACNAATHACVACNSDAQCKSPSAPACNVSTHQCVACDEDAQCKSSAAPACNVSTHSCVACNSNAQCTSSSAPVCNTATHACVGCTSNAQCTSSSAPVCNTATHACVGCSSNAQCKSPTPVCSASSHSCVAH